MNNPQPTPSPMEDSRELNKLLEYIDSECIGVEVGTGRHGLNYDKAQAAVERDRRKSDIRARMDENQSIERVLELEVSGTDFCYNHEKHVAQCYGCRLKKWRGVICKEYLAVIKDRLADLKAELQQLESEE